MRRRVHGIGPAAGVVSLLLAVLGPSTAHAWSAFHVDLYTMDVSLDATGGVTGTIFMDVEVQGGSFRGFKIARGDENLVWSPTSMYCENASGKRYELERVPREDGLTDFRFAQPGFIPRGPATCAISYSLDAVGTGALQIVQPIETDDGMEPERIRLQLRAPGLPVAVEQLVITVHLPHPVPESDRRLGDLTAEEYGVQQFPSAITLTRARPPSYFTGLVEILLPSGALDLPGTIGGGARERGLLSLEPFTGVQSVEAPLGERLSVWIFTGIAAIAIALIALKGRGTAAADRRSSIVHPYLFLPGAHLALRWALGLVLLVAFVLLAGSGRPAPAAAALASALLLNLRGGMRFPALRVDGTSGSGRRVTSWEEAIALVGTERAREARSRLFLDATSLPGAAIAAIFVGGSTALALRFLGDAPSVRDLVIASGALLAVFGFLTSTRLGSSARLAGRTLSRLRRVARAMEEAGREPPGPALTPAGSAPISADSRLSVRNPGSDVRLEVGVEWTRAWSGWRGLYAMVVDLDAVSGALVADAPWLERAEVHTSLEKGRTAILIRTKDPSLPGRVLARVTDHLASARPSCDASSVMGFLSGETPPLAGEDHGSRDAPLDPRPAEG